MSSPALIEVSGVSKAFDRHAGQKLLRHKIGDWLRPTRPDRYFALRNISFRIGKGEAVAFVGSNGAGKSTTLSLVAGLTEPTSGTVKVRGRVAALLELGSGFHPDLTGEENIFVNAALLGSPRQKRRRDTTRSWTSRKSVISSTSPFVPTPAV